MQLDLLSQSPIARNTDPGTSRQAAAAVTRGKRSSQQRECLELVKCNPGKTSAELAVLGKLDRHLVARRLPELRNAELVFNGTPRTCEAAGSRAMTWFSAQH